MALAMLCLTGIVSGKITSWTGAVNNNWTNSGNWNNGVPATGDDVTIPTGSNVTITSVPAISLNSLTVNRTCTFQAASGGTSVTITGNFTVASGVTFTSGNSSGGNNINLASTATGNIAGIVSVYEFSSSFNRYFYCYGDLTITSAGLISGTGEFILYSGSTLRIGSVNGITTAGTSSGNIQTGTRTYSTGANYVYNGTNNQAVGNGLPSTVNSLTITNTGSAGNNIVTLAQNTAITTNLTITSGTLDIRTFTCNRSSSGGTLSLAAGTTLILTGTTGGWVGSNFPNNFSTYTFSPTSTVEYNGTGAQTVASMNLPGYGNLTLSNNSVKTAQGSQNIQGNVLINPTATFAGSSSTSIRVGGNWTNNGTFTHGSGTVEMNGSNAATIGGSSTTFFSYLTINKNAAANEVTSITKAFNAVWITVTQGNLKLEATDANYTVDMHLIIQPDGTLTHSVYWDGTGMALIVGGDIAVDGIFTYTVRSHVQMNRTGTHWVRTGSNAASAFSILTLQNGDFEASGTLKINDNFWAMFFTGGSFHTMGHTVTANAALLNAGGTVYVDGGTLNITSGLHAGTSGGNGSVIISSGTMNVDHINIGSAAIIDPPNPAIPPTSGTITHSGGTVNISGNLTIKVPGALSGTYTCSNSPTINIGGNWINNGTYTRATETVTCNGTSQQTIGGGSITNFYNLSVNNSAGVVLSNDESVGGTLTLLIGLITTGSNAMVLGNNAIINGAGTGKYVYGNLRWNFPAGDQTRNFAVGDASNYTPVTIAFANVTTPGNVTGSTTGTEHPNILISNIDQDKDINRHWTITNSGTLFTSYDATFNYVAGDIDAGADPNAFMVGKYDAGSWIYPTVGTRTGTSIQVTGLTAFSGFAAGQGAAPPTMFIQPVSQSACSGGTASFTASANSIPPSSVVWEVSTDGGLIFAALSATPPPYSVSTSSNAGITTSVLTINPVTGLNSYQYRAVFTNNKGSCTSSAATLTVNTLPTFTVISTNVSCYGGNDGAIQVNVTPSPGNYYFSQDGGTNYTLLTATPYTFTGLVAGTAYIITVKDGNGCVQTNCP